MVLGWTDLLLYCKGKLVVQMGRKQRAISKEKIFDQKRINRSSVLVRKCINQKGNYFVII